MTTPPDVKVSGLGGASIPPGYVLGRTSQGTGAVQLVKISDLARIGVQAGVTAAGGVTLSAFVGFAIPGPMGPLSQWKGAIGGVNVLYPSAATPSYAQCDTRPTESTFTVYIVYDLTAFVASGYPTGALGEDTFASGSSLGTFTWLTGNPIIGPTTPLYLVWPNDFDLTLAGIEVLLAGDIQ